jgi:hypothetical protein
MDSVHPFWNRSFLVTPVTSKGNEHLLMIPNGVAYKVPEFYKIQMFYVKIRSSLTAQEK